MKVWLLMRGRKYDLICSLCMVVTCNDINVVFDFISLCNTRYYFIVQSVCSLNIILLCNHIIPDLGCGAYGGLHSPTKCNMSIRTCIPALYDDRPSHNYIQQYTIYHVTTPSVSPPIDDATTTTHPGFTTTAIIYNNTPSIHVTTPSVSPPIDDATVVVVY